MLKSAERTGSWIRWGKEAPGEVCYCQAIGNLQREFGGLLSDDGDDAAGDEQLEKPLPVLKSLAGEFPAIPDHRYDLAKALRAYEQILGFFKRTDEAVQQMNAALELQTKLVSEHATVLLYQLILTHIFLVWHDSLGGRVSKLRGRARLFASRVGRRTCDPGSRRVRPEFS